MTTIPVSDLQRLRSAVTGAVLTPQDVGWDAARATWNPFADQHPALIVVPEGADDIVQAVRHARARGLRIAAQGTGHGAAVHTGGLLIRTTRMRSVDVDPATRTARVGAGARWSDVVAAATPYGLTGLHGFSGGVGVAGYVLGGGVGWLARRHGFASAFVRGFEVVTQDGERLRVDRDCEPERFWALRGGGGADLVVTGIELDLVALEAVYAGALLWPMERASEVAHAYREWIGTVPDTLTSSLRLMRFPRLPELPAALRGRALVQLTLAFLGDPADGAAQLAPLRALRPEIDAVATVPAASLTGIAGDPVRPAPHRTHSRLLASLTADTVDALVALAHPAVTMLEVRHLGGALRQPADAGAVGPLDAEALVFASGACATLERDIALGGVFAALDTLGPAADRDTLPTFAGPGQATLPPASVERLRTSVSEST